MDPLIIAVLFMFIGVLVGSLVGFGAGRVWESMK